MEARKKGYAHRSYWRARLARDSTGVVLTSAGLPNAARIMASKPLAVECSVGEPPRAAVYAGGRYHCKEL